MINTAITICLIICGTVVVLFIISCIHDYLMATADARSMANFEKAFKEFKENNELNKAGIVKPQDVHFEPVNLQPKDGSELDFPNSRQQEFKDKYH